MNNDDTDDGIKQLRAELETAQTKVKELHANYGLIIAPSWQDAGMVLTLVKAFETFVEETRLKIAVWHIGRYADLATIWREKPTTEEMCLVDRAWCCPSEHFILEEILRLSFSA